MSTEIYNPKEEEFSIQKEIQKYIVHWKWFVISALAVLAIGFLYLKKTVPVYKINSTILIKDDSEGRGLTELAAFEDLAGLSGGDNDIDDEVDIIKSKTIISKVVSKLELHVNQYAKKGLRTIDLYGESPIDVAFSFIENTTNKINDIETGPYHIKINSPKGFSFFDEGVGTERSFRFGDKITTPIGNFVITKNASFDTNLRSDSPVTEIEIFVDSVENTALGYQKRISVQPKSKRSSLLDISFESSNPTKSYNFINTLVNQYNKEAIEDKNLVSKNTIEFVEKRLKRISKELDVVETNKTKFKQGNKLTDLNAEAQLFIDQVGDSQKSLLENETQLDLNRSILDYLTNESQEFALLPANIGINNTSIIQSIMVYNDMILERRRLLEGSTELNPLVRDLTTNIISLKANLIQSIQNEKNNLKVIQKELRKQQSKIDRRMVAIPGIEKDFRVIERQQQIKENLYLFLLKKREEVSISMAVTAPPAKVIDKAYRSRFPVAPKNKIVLAASLLLGLLIPFVFIYVSDLLNTKINEKSDLEKVLKDVPVLVEIGRVKRGDSDILAINDRSVLGESFRILRTNLNYLVKSKKREEKAVRIFITSTVKGEGKTFISFNTVLALADTKKKILVVGADIRNPQLHRYLKNNKNQKGLSEFLYDDSLTYKDVITTIKFNDHNIDYVTSGRIPPNPSELLMNGRLEELLDNVGGLYDYIVVDTAPTMLVTDTQIICESADITLYVARAGYTEKQVLNFAKELKDSGKISNMALVLNDVKEDKIGYGYSYGYGTDKKSFFDKIFKR